MYYTLLPGRTKARKVKHAFLEASETKPTFFDIAKLRQIVTGQCDQSYKI